MKDAKRVSDCLPLPPTPTRRAEDLGCFKIRVTFNKCFNASLNRTSYSFFVFLGYKLNS